MGHIHVGYSNPKREINEKIVKYMDLYLGVPSVIIDQKSRDRRKLYGKAGCFREKPYGLEYRSLSNFWAFNVNYMHWIVNTVDIITSELVENYSFKFSDELIKKICDCINNSDVRLAKEICKEFNIPIPKSTEKKELVRNVKQSIKSKSFVGVNPRSISSIYDTIRTEYIVSTMGRATNTTPIFDELLVTVNAEVEAPTSPGTPNEALNEEQF